MIGDGGPTGMTGDPETFDRVIAEGRTEEFGGYQIARQLRGSRAWRYNEAPGGRDIERMT